MDRFYQKVNKNSGVFGIDGKFPTECWEWIGGKNSEGYGYFYLGKKSIPAHRASFIIHHGSLDDEIFVLHKCDYRACVRPNHLFTGTQQDNVNDCATKGRRFRPVGELHPRAKLNIGKITIMNAFRQSGMTYKEIADMFGVAPSTAFNAINRIKWKHLNE